MSINVKLIKCPLSELASFLERLGCEDRLKLDEILRTFGEVTSDGTYYLLVNGSWDGCNSYGNLFEFIDDYFGIRNSLLAVSRANLFENAICNVRLDEVHID